MVAYVVETVRNQYHFCFYVLNDLSPSLLDAFHSSGTFDAHTHACPRAHITQEYHANCMFWKALRVLDPSIIASVDKVCISSVVQYICVGVEIRRMTLDRGVM